MNIELHEEGVRPACTSSSAEKRLREECTAGDDQVNNSSPCTTCCNKKNGQKTELSNSAFRQVEKKYKLYQLPRRQARRQSVEETDFTDVVDFRNIEKNTQHNRDLINKVATSDPNVVCYTFAGVPGLLIFPDVLSKEEQVHWCRESVLSFADSRMHPTILSTHAKEPRETTCYQPPLRWSTLGFGYQWTSKTYSRDKHSVFPTGLKQRMEELMQIVSLVQQDEWVCKRPEEYQPQTAIVNYYPVGSMMMCHQDVSEEVLDQPLVSISLGCSAIFLMGTQSRDDAPYAFLLKSGDVAAFAGPSRTAFHATPRILDDCPDYLTVPWEDMTESERNAYITNAYHRHPTPDGSFVMCDKDAMSEAERERYWRLCMRHMRVNLNARQVYSDDCAHLFVE